MKLNKSFPFLCGIIIILQLSGCLRNQPKQILLYENNFEEKRLNIDSTGFGPLFNITPSFKGQFNPFDGSTVFGNHGRGSIFIEFFSLPRHDYVKMEFDLYIHDQWQGNGNSDIEPDIFILNLDESTIYYSTIINTGCQGFSCESYQSFPDIINIRNNRENANIENSSLYGWCSWNEQLGGSKKIRITKLYPHTLNTALIHIGADLKDTGSDLCTKSWSIDNLSISIIEIPEL